MNNLEELMTELVRSSVALKRKLYRRDEAAATSPEGTDAPTLLVHTCMVCERSAAGEGAQVRHGPSARWHVFSAPRQHSRHRGQRCSQRSRRQKHHPPSASRT